MYNKLNVMVINMICAHNKYDFKSEYQILT